MFHKGEVIINIKETIDVFFHLCQNEIQGEAWNSPHPPQCYDI